MSNLPTWVKASLAVYLAFVTITGTAEAAYHLTYESPPTKGMNFLPEIEGLQNHYVTGTLAVPKPVIRSVALRAPTRLPGGSLGPSTNRFVEPNGCEASHTQQWSPSGKYWGKYQFDRQTWSAHGGNSNEYGSADVQEQDRIAAKVAYDAWPNC